MAGGGSFSVDYSDLDKFVGEIRKAPKIVTEELKFAVDRILAEIVRLAVRNITANNSVVTGNLRRSIAAKPARKAGGTVRGSAGTNVLYARPVEFGRVAIDVGPGRVLAFRPKGGAAGGSGRNAGWVFRQRVGPAAPRPFLRPAFQQVKPGAQKELKAAISRIIDRLAKAA